MVENNFFLNMIKQSLFFSKKRLFIIFLAIFIGAATTNSFLNVYFDIDNKMSKELKAYGANMSLFSVNKDYITNDEVNSIKNKLDKKKLVAFSKNLFFSANYSSRQILINAVEFDNFKSVNKFLQVIKGSLNPSDYKADNVIYLGVDLAATLDKSVDNKITLTYTNNSQIIEKSFYVKGIFSSGDENDAMAFIPLNSAQEFTHIKNAISYVNIIYDDDFNSLEELSKKLSTDELSLSVIKSVSVKEGAILEKIKGLMFLISLVILIISSTSVNTTLGSIIFARKKEIALHIALGASKKDIIRLFSCEVFAIALFSSLLGCIGGYALAQILGKIIFNSSIDFRFFSFFVAIFISLFFAAIASYLPIKRTLQVDIIDNLRGE